MTPSNSNEEVLVNDRFKVVTLVMATVAGIISTMESEFAAVPWIFLDLMR